MTDLDTLRPEVREAVERMIVLCAAADKTGKWVRADCDVVIIAELLRLTRENEDLRSKCNVIMSGSTRHLGRAERAEAELAALKADHAALEELCDATVRANLALGHVEE